MDKNSLHAEITITRELDYEELKKRLSVLVGSEITPETRTRIADAVQACIKTDVDIRPIPNVESKVSE